MTVLAALAVAVSGGCVSDLKSDWTLLQESRQDYIAANPGLDTRTIDAIKSGKLVIGMTPAEVSAAWGRPYRINKFSNLRLEEWIFGCDYPHYCVQRDRHGRFSAGILFDSVIHMSRAHFSEGRLTEWSQ